MPSRLSQWLFERKYSVRRRPARQLWPLPTAAGQAAGLSGERSPGRGNMQEGCVCAKSPYMWPRMFLLCCVHPCVRSLLSPNMATANSASPCLLPGLPSCDPGAGRGQTHLRFGVFSISGAGPGSKSHPFNRRPTQLAVASVSLVPLSMDSHPKTRACTALSIPLTSPCSQEL